VYTGTHAGTPDANPGEIDVTRGIQDEIRSCPCSRGGSPDVATSVASLFLSGETSFAATHLAWNGKLIATGSGRFEWMR
jgi:hypothetical protein